MPEIYKIAKLSINAMATPPRIAMMEDFAKTGNRQHSPTVGQRTVYEDIRGFASYTDIGTTVRGTTILTRDDIRLRI